MKAIGGYFELELNLREHYHKNAIYLNTARNCFEYILIARNYRKVYIPYYTCEVMLQPLQKHHVKYEFYSINEQLEPTENIYLLENEAFLYTNYFGLKQNCVESLSVLYGSQLIVDNAQAFYAPPINGIDTFYSPRKFFGVPDGGILYTDSVLEQDFPEDKSYDRMQHLLQRIDEDAESGYAAFRRADDELDYQPIKKMSALTEKILESINYDEIREKRVRNYQCLHDFLSSTNKFDFQLHENDVPMVYPYLPLNGRSYRTDFIMNRVFVATYWLNVLQWSKKDSLECLLAEKLLPLPIDQRYSTSELYKLFTLI